MKPKISPEEYRETLATIDLSNVTLIESKCKLNMECITDDMTISIKDKTSYSQTENKLIIDYKFFFKGKSENKEKPGIDIVALYQIIYDKYETEEIAENFFDPFEKFVVGLMIWTYFREFVQSTISRMNLPPLTLPLKRL